MNEVPIVVVAAFTFLGAALTAFVTWLIAQRQILAKHVTAERAEWRKNVRARALEVHDSILCGDDDKIRRLRSEFRALLNPFDCQDQAILNCMTLNGSREQLAEEFAERISLLLKHDWERAKLEAGFFLFRWTKEPRRLPLNWRDSGSLCISCRKLRWCEKNRIKWSGILILFIAAVVVAGILFCLWKGI